MPRVWSARTRSARSTSPLEPARLPDSSSPSADQRDELVGVEDRRRRPAGSPPCRFRPRPVSMFCAGSGVSVFTGSCSNCMNTRFQYSRKRSFSPPGRSSALAEVAGRGRGRARSTARTGRSGPACQKFSQRGQLDDPLARDADRQPRLDRLLVGAEAELLVALEDRDPDVVRVEAEALQRQLPRELDRALLEVVADREVAEHLEERQVARRQADLVDVRRAEALLAARQPVVRRLLAALEVRLERVHARRGEQHRRIVLGRHERRRKGCACGRGSRRS